MSHHKKHTNCKTKQPKQTKESKQLKESMQIKYHPEEYKQKQQLKGNKKCNSFCSCEQKFYFPLPNLPFQPVGGMKVNTDAWFAPGSVQSCCATCSTVQPVYANHYNTCRYNNGHHPINNTAYYTTHEYIY